MATLIQITALVRESPNANQELDAGFRVEMKHRIAQILARITRKFDRSTKIEIENAQKKLLDLCSDRKMVENFLLAIARIESQCSKCLLEDRN